MVTVAIKSPTRKPLRFWRHSKPLHGIYFDFSVHEYADRLTGMPRRGCCNVRHSCIVVRDRMVVSKSLYNTPTLLRRLVTGVKMTRKNSIVNTIATTVLIVIPNIIYNGHKHLIFICNTKTYCSRILNRKITFHAKCDQDPES